MSPFVSRGRTVAPAMSLFSESPRTAQTGQFQSPQLARTAIGWSQSPQQRNGGLRKRGIGTLLLHARSKETGLQLAGQATFAHSSMRDWQRFPFTHLLQRDSTSSKQRPRTVLQRHAQQNLLHAQQQRNAPPSRTAAKKCSRHFHVGTGNKETFQTLPRGPAKTFSSRTAKMKTGQQDRLSSSRLTHSSVPLFHAHQSALLSHTGTPQAARTAQEMATYSSHDLLLL
ncbi:hypothetical protein KI387_005687 [Taxus chinensis]|uniref:Uncharacterized protein n=1 Tax=Taxus chinensis TaxID=29808 RepID=A0AA38GKU5_TAXCH|nr:hypothetical protein KI387_005687 [Taxus chinensis]